MTAAETPSQRAARVALPADMLEDAWTRWVIDAALLQGWRVSHPRPARTVKGWRTAVRGHTGVPDLLLARDSDVILAELKTNRGRLRPDQRLWLDHLGPYGVVWRPRDADEVLARLARNRTPTKETA